MHDLEFHLSWSNAIHDANISSVGQVVEKFEHEIIELEQAKNKAESDLVEHKTITANEIAALQGQVNELARQLAASKVNTSVLALYGNTESDPNATIGGSWRCLHGQF